MAKLSTGQIKGMFAKFFSIPEFDQSFFAYWLPGGAGEKDEESIKEACEQLHLDMTQPHTAADVIAAVRKIYINPNSWRRTSKGKICKFTGDNPFESGKIEDFEDCCGELGHVEDVDLFNKHAASPDMGAKCIARSFYLQPGYDYEDYFGSEDVELIVVSDPSDSAVIGWFFHID